MFLSISIYLHSFYGPFHISLSDLAGLAESFDLADIFEVDFTSEALLKSSFANH